VIWQAHVALGKTPEHDLAALLHAARAGLGVAALPCFLAAHDPALCLLSDHTCSTVRQLWLVMHPDGKRSPRVRLIADLLVDLIGKTPGLSLKHTQP
jgi:DNA-binding transcriptional LysR family regulator